MRSVVPALYERKGIQLQSTSFRRNYILPRILANKHFLKDTRRLKLETKVRTKGEAGGEIRNTMGTEISSHWRIPIQYEEHPIRLL